MAARAPDAVASRRPRVVVVGGGLTGLATAWHLRHVAAVTVLEAGERPGGALLTVELAGRSVDVGADAFLAREPEAERLVRALGLADDLVVPATGRVLLWVRRRLRPLPAATVLGVPTDLAALARARVLSPAGFVRAALEPLVPRRTVPGDRSVGDLVAERFGREVADLLVEPLLAGVYAGAVDRLSAEAAAAALWHGATRHRSLLLGLRAGRRVAPGRGGPVFRTLAGGLGQLTGRLAAATDVRVRSPVVSITRHDHRWRVELGTGQAIDADQVVVAVPPVVAAALLAATAPEAARELAGIRTASVTVVALAYGREATAEAPLASGILVPRSEGRLVKAITLSSRKWPHHATGDAFVVRASVGRIDDQRGLDLADDTLARRVDAEVRWATGIRRPAAERRVVRWWGALPQYDVGHVRRVDRIRAAIADLPAGLHLGGAALDGVGVPARARDAERLADAVLRVAATPAADRRSAGGGRPGPG